jgi:hypothetical protein
MGRSGCRTRPSTSAAAHPPSLAAAASSPAPHAQPRGGRIVLGFILEIKKLQAPWALIRLLGVGISLTCGFLRRHGGSATRATQACSGQARVRHALRHRVTDSSNRKTARLLSTLGDEEPVIGSPSTRFAFSYRRALIAEAGRDHTAASGLASAVTLTGAAIAAGLAFGPLERFEQVNSPITVRFLQRSGRRSVSDTQPLPGSRPKARRIQFRY